MSSESSYEKGGNEGVKISYSIRGKGKGAKIKGGEDRENWQKQEFCSNLEHFYRNAEKI